MKIEMALHKILPLLLAFTFVLSCSSTSKSIHYVYSPDKKQCITIIESAYTRYIIDGKHTSAPETNFVLLNTNHESEFGEEIVGCWKNENYEWRIIVNGANIIKNKLDTTRFVFEQHLPVDENGIPLYYIEGCYHFGTEYYSVIPQGSAIIE